MLDWSLGALGALRRHPGTSFHVVLDYDLLRAAAADVAAFSSDNGLLQIRPGELGSEIRRVQAKNGIYLTEHALLHLRDKKAGDHVRASMT